MRFRDRFRKTHHGFSTLQLYVVIPALTLIVPVIALITGIRRRRPNSDGMTVPEFGWLEMGAIWLILLAFMYLVYVPFLASHRNNRRKNKP